MAYTHPSVNETLYRLQCIHCRYRNLKIKKKNCFIFFNPFIDESVLSVGKEAPLLTTTPQSLIKGLKRWDFFFFRFPFFIKEHYRRQISIISNVDPLSMVDYSIPLLFTNDNADPLSTTSVKAIKKRVTGPFFLFLTASPPHFLSQNIFASCRQHHWKLSLALLIADGFLFSSFFLGRRWRQFFAKALLLCLLW